MANATAGAAVFFASFTADGAESRIEADARARVRAALVPWLPGARRAPARRTDGPLASAPDKESRWSQHGWAAAVEGMGAGARRMLELVLLASTDRLLYASCAGEGVDQCGAYGRVALQLSHTARSAQQFDANPGLAHDRCWRELV